MRQNFDVFFVRFLIYIRFSSNLEQSQKSRSIRLKMAQEKVKTFLLENHEKVTFFFLYSFTLSCRQLRLNKVGIKIRHHKGSRGSLASFLILIQLKILEVRWWTYGKKTKQYQLSGCHTRLLKKSTNQCPEERKLSVRPKEVTLNTKLLKLIFPVMYWCINELIP